MARAAGNGQAGARKAGPQGGERELSPRALAAIAEAARRSRETAGGGVGDQGGPPAPAVAPPGADMPAGADGPGDHRPAPATPDRVGRDTGRRRRNDRVLVAAIVVVAAALLLVVGALAASPGKNRSSPAAPTVPPTTGPGTTLAARSPSTTLAPATATPSTTPLTTPLTTAPAPAPAAPGPVPTAGGAPVLSSLDPSSGPPGQTVVVTGTGFLSPSGQITAYVGSQVAPVSCPVQTTCTVTVPAVAGPPAVTPAATAPVTITTDSGTSNPLTFIYG